MVQILERWITAAKNDVSQVFRMIATEHHYIVRDDAILGGEPIVRGTRTPVRALVELWRLGVPPEEIPLHLPHVTLAQVFDALSYYEDHRAEIHAYIERNRVPDELIHPACPKASPQDG